MKYGLTLYFSITSSFLFLALKKGKKLLESLQKENTLKHTDNFLEHLEKILNSQKKELSKITKIYFSSWPGGLSAARVGFVFVTILKALNPKIKIYHINTLLLQSGGEDCISLLSIDKKKKKYFFMSFKKNRENVPLQIKNKEEIEKEKKKNPNTKILLNFENQKILSLFEKLKKTFSIFNINLLKKEKNNKFKWTTC